MKLLLTLKLILPFNENNENNVCSYALLPKRTRTIIVYYVCKMWRYTDLQMILILIFLFYFRQLTYSHVSAHFFSFHSCYTLSISVCWLEIFVSRTDGLLNRRLLLPRLIMLCARSNSSAEGQHNDRNTQM